MESLWSSFGSPVGCALDGFLKQRASECVLLSVSGGMLPNVSRFTWTKYRRGAAGGSHTTISASRPSIDDTVMKIDDILMGIDDVC